MSLIVPAVWLIVIIVGLPQFSETVYTPSLPDIARALSASPAMVEYTLTIYLFAFALGTFFWGWLSDLYGRKPCMVAGLFIFIAGCLGCFYSSSIELLLMSRFIQAFGGSVGSVLGQAICRDAFQGPALGRVYSSAGSALAVFPAVGPVVGGLIAQQYGWSTIFLFLIGAALCVLLLVARFLPETHSLARRNSVSIQLVTKALVQDRNVLLYAMVIGICNGLSFSYFAEASFILIQVLSLTPSHYGMSFSVIALATMCGGLVSRWLHKKHSSLEIMQRGLWVIVLGAGILLVTTGAFVVFALSQWLCIGGIVGGQMVVMAGVCMATSNALSMALVQYKWCIGTASSVFGLFYYVIVSVATLGMGLLHTGSVLVMPLYFVLLSVGMLYGARSLK